MCKSWRFWFRHIDSNFSNGPLVGRTLGLQRSDPRWPLVFQNYPLYNTTEDTGISKDLWVIGIRNKNIEQALAFTVENSKAAWKMYQPQTQFSHRIINTSAGGVAEQQQCRQNPILSAGERRSEDLVSPASAATTQQGDKLCREGPEGFTRARQSCQCGTGREPPGVSR